MGGATTLAWKLGLLLAALAAAAGCVGEDERPATFSYVHATIIQPACATSSCHSSLGATAGLQFDTKTDAYYYLTGRNCTEDHDPAEAPGNFVVPGQPERSKLMYQLRGIEVRRMPPDMPLPEVDIDLVERWILEGAPCE